MSLVAVVVSLVSYLPVEFDRRATNHIARMTAHVAGAILIPAA